MESEPRWLSRDEVDALHFELIRLYGGEYGIRDDDLVESALSRPRNQWHYGGAQLSELAAAYGFGLVKNHGYVDGNKRTALACMDIFLLHNGHELVVSNEEAQEVVEEVATGRRSEEELGTWIENVIEAAPPTQDRG